MRRQLAPPLSFSGVDERTVFRSIFSAHPDAMLLVDAEGRIVISNPAAEALLGYTADEFAGRAVDDLVPDGIRPRHAAYRERYGRAPRPRPMGTQMDLVARRRDGSEVTVEIALSPLQDHGLPFVVASIRDVGTYPRVRQALQRARYSEHLAQFGRLVVDERDPRVLLSHAPRLAAEALEAPMAVVCLLDDGASAFRVAGGAGLLPELQPGNAIANTPDTLPGYLLAHPFPLVLPDYAEERRFPLPGFLRAAGLRCGVVLPLTDRGRTFGTLAVHARRPQAFGDDELRFLDSLCSMLATALQRAQTEDALNHSQRLESVGQLTGGIAHDFNNLLTVIQGNLQFLEEAPALADDAHGQRLVAAARRASKRAAELTGKLLAFSRRQVLQPAAVDVGAMLHSLGDMLRRTLEQRIRIEIEVAAGCPRVLADPTQLESALLNVAINARDAMPDGGILRFAAAHGAGEVSITVADTGTGMPDDVRERAFEPFFTTKGAGRGTGLGLSTVYGFVTQSRGTVAIESAPGAGTTVVLRFPSLAADEPTVADDTVQSHAVPPGLRVLLVEDDPAVRAVALGFLEAFAADVTSCATAEEALPLVAAGAVDLLVSDIALGAGLRGTELAAQAQRHVPGLAVLLVSGYSAELIDADRTVPPDWELLPKPYARADLARAIAPALRQAAARGGPA